MAQQKVAALQMHSLTFRRCCERRGASLRLQGVRPGSGINGGPPQFGRVSREREHPSVGDISLWNLLSENRQRPRLRAPLIELPAYLVPVNGVNFTLNAPCHQKLLRRGIGPTDFLSCVVAQCLILLLRYFRFVAAALRLNRVIIAGATDRASGNKIY